MEQELGSLVLIPGWGMRSTVWKSLDLQLRDSYHLIYPQFDDCVSPDQFGGAVLREVCDEKRVSLVGWSLGGMLALELAAIDPERFEQVVVIGAGAKFVTDPTYRAGQPLASVNRMKRNLERSADGTLHLFYESLFTKQERALHLDDILLDQAKDWPLSSIDSLRAGLDYLTQTDLRDRLPNINVPVAVIHGQLDPICSIESGRQLAQQLAHATFIEVPDAGHMPFGFQGYEFHQLIRSALEK
ncbi:MAG: Biotin synthesis protein BioH [Bacilli bacterium]|nr:Biotin synthesis protein BioH [Bacilli bacterium]